MMRTVFRHLRNLLRSPARLDTLSHAIERMEANQRTLIRLATEGLRSTVVRNDPKRNDPRDLLRFGYRVCSQNDEDGIIEEIFRRIGCGDRRFVEFGVGSGLENNTAYLLHCGWRGVWLDAVASNVGSASQALKSVIAAGRLNIIPKMVSAENIEGVFRDAGVPSEPDLVSIDIDGNDFWVWSSLVNFRPRVVVIEYNAGMGPSLDWVVPYDASRPWDGSRTFGASLAALVRLGREKGYRLVGCCFAGVNAFFVRRDVAGECFSPRDDSQYHFQPARYYAEFPNGHPVRPHEFS